MDSKTREAFSQLEIFSRRLLINAFQRMGAFRLSRERYHKEELRDFLGIIPKYYRLYEALLDILVRGGFIRVEDSDVIPMQKLADNLEVLKEKKRDLEAAHSEIKSHLELLWTCGIHFPDICRGYTAAPDIIFPNSSSDLVNGIYKGYEPVDFFNRLVARSVKDYIEARLPFLTENQRIKILEAGAGTGGTSAFVLDMIRSYEEKLEYIYTDITKAFTDYGKEAYGRQYSFMQFNILDIEHDIEMQGYTPGDFDMVIGSNVLHAMRRLRDALRNVKALLKRHGVLILNEATQIQDFATLTFGLLDGWWLFEDEEIRLKYSPLLSADMWKKILEEEGFRGICMLPSDDSAEEEPFQHIFIGESNGELRLNLEMDQSLIDRGILAKKSEKEGFEGPIKDHKQKGLAQKNKFGKDIRQYIEEHILESLSNVLHIEKEEFDKETPYAHVGVDSILAIDIIKRINDELGLNLRSTDLFNFATIQKLTDHISERFGHLIDFQDKEHIKTTELFKGSCSDFLSQRNAHEGKEKTTQRMIENSYIQEIAIIGISGRFPSADNVKAFWENLAKGKDSVREIPKDRWDVDLFYDPDPKAVNKSYCKVGGFISDIERFDPLFFNISPREAEFMDPQQRIFLEQAWTALEDAGYSDKVLDGMKVGVFIGFEGGDYLSKVKEEEGCEKGYTFIGNAPSILGARISFFLNLKGPCIIVNTACSSSLVAVHLACESIRSGTSDCAIAGGVGLLTNPMNYIALSAMGMLSVEGKCKTFDNSADGFVPGEGVGVIVLKPLELALKSRDHIYAVIKGSGINQDGKTNGITAPCATSQTALECEVYDRFCINPETITYIEAHGTGTILGDPIEVQALTDAFKKYTNKKAYCGIGSVKTNIGHALAAAGIASLIKVILSLKHKKIPPSLHFKTVNDHINLKESPFYVNTDLKEWIIEGNSPRRAGISAFGFSGTNCHMVLEEGLIQKKVMPYNHLKPFYLIPLSGKTKEALHQRVKALSKWLEEKGGSHCIEDIAYTLHIGRSHFDLRSAFIVKDINDLKEKISEIIRKGTTENYVKNKLKKGELNLSPLSKELGKRIINEMQDENILTERDYKEKLLTLADLYVKGYDLEWESLYIGEDCCRISLPTYPFTLESYWILNNNKEMKGVEEEGSLLHPLLDRNASTLSEHPKEEVFERSSGKGRRLEMKGLSLRQCVEWDLKEHVSTLLKIPRDKLDMEENLADFGFDSIRLAEFATLLTDHYDIETTPALFFGHATLGKLAQYFLAEHEEAIQKFYQEDEDSAEIPQEVSVLTDAPKRENLKKSRFIKQGSFSTIPEPIAIIGMSGRFPQARNIDEMWRILVEGKDVIQRIPEGRWSGSPYYGHMSKGLSQTIFKCGSVPGVDEFDPLFFEISPLEAERMDPRQRLLLQESWKALEDAGYGGTRLSKSTIAMYVGVEEGDYHLLNRGRGNITSNHNGILAARLAYFLDFSGPTMAINTACSSGLVAAHQACQSLRNGECDTAIVAGVSLILTSLFFEAMKEAGMLSEDGTCYAFDRRANGMVPGEAVAVVVLKALAQAEADGDSIYGVIKGSGVNYDGRTNGITAPSGVSQTNLLRTVYDHYKINPEEIEYIVTHGTGTRLGDPVEINALYDTFKEYTKKQGYCALTSIKSNIGHTFAASGLVSLISLVQAFEHETIPASVHCEQENDYINWKKSPFYVNKKNKPWPKGKGKSRMGAVSAFGVSGTNAHMVLESYCVEDSGVSGVESPYFLLALSAKTQEALHEKIKDMIAFLQEKDLQKKDLSRISYTLLEGRQHFNYRCAVVIRDLEDAVYVLKQFGGKEKVPNLFQGKVSRDFTEQRAMQKYARDLLEQSVSLKGDKKEYQEILYALGDLYCQGYDIPWSRLFGNTPPRPIRLPTYPFARERYWAPKAGDEETDYVSEQGLRSVGTDTAPVPQVSGTIYYGRVWEESGVVQGDQPLGKKARPLLLFDTDGALGNVLKMSVSDKESASVVLVKPAKGYASLGDGTYTMNPGEPADYIKLLAELKEQNRIPEQVFYLGPFQTKAASGQVIGVDSDAFLQKGVYPIFYLIKAFSEIRIKSLARLVFVFKGESQIPDPFMEAVSGYCRSIGFIWPGLTFSTVELSGAGMDKNAVLDIVKQEFNQKEAHHEIRYENGRRYVKKVVPLPLGHPRDQRLRREGVYLITGGMGGLGFLFSRYLAEQYRGKLVLTGRSALDGKGQEKLEGLRQLGSEVIYIRADVADEKDMERVLERMKEHYGVINGVIHAAGIASEHIITQKDIGELKATLRPKVQGTMVLDQVTKAEALDFFMMFSSSSSILGDFGQCDYAIGNRFMDSYAHLREHLRAQGKCHGQSIAVNWPLWKSGGMHLNQEGELLYLQSSGMSYLEEEDGLNAFEQIVGGRHSQVMVIAGDPKRVNRFLGIEEETGGEPQAKKAGEHKMPEAPHHGFRLTSPSGAFPEIRIKTDIQKIASDLIKIDPQRLDMSENLGSFGFDSITLKNLATKISEVYQVEISPTVFFQHPTLEGLIGYLLEEFGEELRGYYKEPEKGDSRAKGKARVLEQARPVSLRQGFSGEVDSTGAHHKGEGWSTEKEGVAIIGISGIFPGSRNLEEFWENLEAGKDLITDIPKERWDWREHYGDSANEKSKSNSKWGGFIDGVDKFDARFFKISPREAELMDPQHRLFLETVWKAIEDSGYKVSGFAGRAIGVFVGVQFNDYQQLLRGPEGLSALAATGNAISMLPNRVSYFLNLRGPSEAIDTACSSSLVALHHAVRSVLHGESEMAIAGGVSLILSPSNVRGASQLGILSPDGRCKTFDKSANGYVKGEGIGALLLKPLSKAIEDHDHLYGVIKGSGENHGGKANSLTAPNSEAQAALLVSTYEEAGIDPETVSYIEVHGTGTELGDPVEIEGLKSAWKELIWRQKKEGIRGAHYCGLGTVKTNIGHLEPAAGIAGVIKVLLSMKHKKLPGNLHFKELNPYIELEGSPFYIVDCTKAWDPLRDATGKIIPRRAGVSSFGFGGANAHVVLEEYESLPCHPMEENPGPHIIVLSAKDEERLKAYAGEIRDFLGRATSSPKCFISLSDLAYTLQVGREVMEERLAVVASSIEELREKLDQFSKGKAQIEDVLRGNGKTDGTKSELLLEGREGEEFIKVMMSDRKLTKLARLWISGVEIDWRLLYPSRIPNRISLPTYPFARDRYWVSKIDKKFDDTTPSAIAADVSPQLSDKPRHISLPSLTDVQSHSILPSVHIQPSVSLSQPEIERDEGKPVTYGKAAVSVKTLQEELRTSLAAALYMDRSEVGVDKAFVDMGLDSIIGVEWIRMINKEYGTSIPATKVYDYPNVRAFAGFLEKELPQRPLQSPPSLFLSNQSLIGHSSGLSEKELFWVESLSQNQSSETKNVVAIIGMSGRYPDARDLAHYWDNLVQGKDSIREIPKSRWDINQYYDPRPLQKGKVYCKWLGLLEGIDYFDPLFFNISPAEAEIMDPQHRLFLQEAYKAFEDAGYSPQSLSNKKCGVYLGIMSSEYNMMLYKNGVGETTSANSYAIAAARIPYYLNLKGVAMPIDTACSSSLVAVHLACRALLDHEIDMALVGGVSLYLTPELYIGMCATGILSPEGKCKPFDNSADGFIPGEGVGAVVLKRLKEAESDHDSIYGVIIGSGMNHNGETNGISAPSRTSQIELERDIYNKYKINPEGIHYVEMHGTGTKLGDTIELEALSTVFKEKTKKRNYCAIGSVKGNIGHTSAASGMASIHKVLLSMKHKKLVPTLHLKTYNEHFDFKDSPFYVNAGLQLWENASGLPLRAGVSSFGFSGTNAHVVIEEYIPKIDTAITSIQINTNIPIVFVLSAKTEAQLKIYAESMKNYIEKQRDLNLVDMAYTLQIGRKAMDYRLAFFVDSREVLLKALEEFIHDRLQSEVLTNKVKKGEKGVVFIKGDEDTKAFPIQKEPLKKEIELWTKGMDMDWTSLLTKLYGNIKPHRISLPTYPFAKVRYWSRMLDVQGLERGENNIMKYPLLHQNTSDFLEQRLSSSSAGGEFFLEDHIGDVQRAFQGVACPEIAQEAVEQVAGALKKGQGRSLDYGIPIDTSSLLNKVQWALIHIVSKLLQVNIEDIDPNTELNEYGFDSIALTKFATQINQKYDLKLTPTVFFEHINIARLSKYLIEEHQSAFAEHIPIKPHDEKIPSINRGFVKGAHTRNSSTLKEEEALPESIAIVGMSCQFPMAGNANEFWHNLVEGKDCITEIPKDRWDWRAYYGDPTKEANKTNIKWGGFIDGVADFDPIFFGISPKEAVLMDPRQRLLMMHIWKCLEDAGYLSQSISGTKTAIFVGTATSEYSVLVAQSNLTIEGSTSIGMVPSVGPNRMSYFLNIHGPSEPIETACSSSLVAIHRAVEAVKHGNCDMAIAGGVNTMITPGAHISFNKAGMLCEDGRCKAFSDKANGYVRGEGVGMLFLKKLRAAEKAGDHIYGVIRSTAVNHGGRSNSLTAPNPKAQAELLQTAYTRAGIDPRTVGYIEAHGTGTQLGDPVEIEGLKMAFKELYKASGNPQAVKAHCGLGTVKTNIGHLELAAGIAGVIKVLLQLKHKTLVKSLHCEIINPYIQLKDSPFYIVRETKEWSPLQDAQGKDLPRRAGVSSFGFGGVNAHVVIEEYIPKDRGGIQVKGSYKHPAIIVLSAKDERQLEKQAQQLYVAIKEQQFSDTILYDMAYTLQVGRDAMEERLAMIVDSIKELEEKLQDFLKDRDGSEDLYHGHVKRNKDTLAIFAADDDLQRAIDAWINKRKYSKFLDLWVKGLIFDWNKLYGENKHRRISLPTYPFALNRYWITEVSAEGDSQISDNDVSDGESIFSKLTDKPKGISLEPLSDDRIISSKPTCKTEGSVSLSQSEPKDEEKSITHIEASISMKSLLEKLRTSLAEALYMERNSVDLEKPFIDMGLDSVIGVEWIRTINKHYGTCIPVNKLYDYPSIREFAGFLKRELKKTVNKKSCDPGISPPYQTSSKVLLDSLASPSSGLSGKESSSLKTSSSCFYHPEFSECKESIAIIGMSGRYPDGGDLNQYWDNLVQGKNSIREIPRSRWDVNHYYDPRPSQKGKVYCKWLGLLEDIDYFDPLFFNISPAEAEIMDPQHRLFLQEAYKAFEDAGYSRPSLSNKKCGVYLGIMSNEYSMILYQNQNQNQLKLTNSITSNSNAIAAARIPYYLNLKGVAMPIDTACSSSLVGTHLACQALLHREIDMALVGGVSLYLTPELYIGMCEAGMLSPEGQCKPFDNSADGFVPGEGVGALVLKRLKDAESDHDFIYGVIIGSGINQNGKTNGITSPNIKSQIELVREIYDKYKVDPESISYIEAHATGTKMGDFIELNALSTVFKEKTNKKNYCAIGSVKSNIGHTSAASGMASIQKVLLSMKHKKLVPTLNFKTNNQHFQFEDSPFYINTQLQSWENPLGFPLRAGVSSLGYSGTNAHVVIEEYIPETDTERTPIQINTNNPIIFVLSGKTEAQLKIYAESMKNFIEKRTDINLVDMAYTLQVGREAMDFRMAFLADSREVILKALEGFIYNRLSMGVFTGQAKSEEEDERVFPLRKKNLKKAAELWVNGLDMVWSQLYDGAEPRRMSLPTHPFAKEHYWIHGIETNTTGTTTVSTINSEIKNFDDAFYGDIVKKITKGELTQEQFEKIIMK